MNRRDRKSVTPGPAAVVQAEPPDRHEQSKPAQEEVEADSLTEAGAAGESVASFDPNQGDAIDGSDGGTASRPSSGVEQAEASPPEQIDPGADGKLVI